MKRYDESIQTLLRENHGMLRAADFAAREIPRTYLSIMEKRGSIERVACGVYVAGNALEDEMWIFQLRQRQVVYSHETALYLHGLSDRTPLAYSVTVPSGYHSQTLKRIGCKVFSVKAALHQLGCVLVTSPHGNPLKVYNLERTVCDVVRGRSRIDSQIFNDALKGYVKRTETNLSLLMNYAENFGIAKIVRQYVEILL